MPTVSIGDFSRMTHLSIKTLRHYHDVGLLEPAEIDSATGYRYYAREQVPTAQVIRRFRGIGMPVNEVRALLDAATPAARNDLIHGHLDRLQTQLAETQASVAALRAILEHPQTTIDIEYRNVDETIALAISEHVTLSAFHDFWREGFTEIRGVLRSLGLVATASAGGLYSTELFANEEGEAVLFIPIAKHITPVGRVHSRAIPKAELAVAVHRGSHDDVDRTYGALGTHVAEHELGVEGPVREYYSVDRFVTSDAKRWVTEIGWPIFQASNAPAPKSKGARRPRG